MSENAKGTGTLIAWCGLVLAGLAIIVPIVWDHYKGKTSLDLQFLSSITLVESQTNLDKLTILYDGQPIKSVAKGTFVIVNSGRSPIQQNDLKIPPTLTFDKDTTILDVYIESKNPPDFEVNPIISTNRKSVAFSFPLLNPEDDFRFSVLVSGKINDFAATARVVNVKEMSVIDRSNQLGRKKLRWTDYVVAGCTLLWFMAGVGLINDLKIQKRVRTLFLGSGFKPPVPDSPVGYEFLIQYLFKGRQQSELIPIRSLIGKLQSNSPISSENHEKIVEEMRALALRSTNTFGAIIISFLLAGVGGAYFVMKLVLLFHY